MVAVATYPATCGVQVRCGARHSIPSSNIESCAGVSAAGKEITTIEGLAGAADGRLPSVQQAFECVEGFCRFLLRPGGGKTFHGSCCASPRDGMSVRTAARLAVMPWAYRVMATTRIVRLRGPSTSVLPLMSLASRSYNLPRERHA